MLDRSILWDQFLDFLQTTPASIESLAEAPEAPQTFDPYQFVSEWIALRQEMKQQGKLLQAAQHQLQQELEAARSQNQQLQQHLESLPQSFGAEQDRLFKELLTIVDALDRACSHWQAQEQKQILPLSSTPSLRENLSQWLAHLSQSLSPHQSLNTGLLNTGLLNVISSDREGIELIRRSFLDLLRQHQIVPISTLGQSFDPECMYALGQQPSDAPANTVIQEVLRGYRLPDRILREAQVIVSNGKAPSTKSS